MLLCLTLLAGCGDSGSAPNASGSAPEGEAAQQPGGEEASQPEESSAEEQGEALHISIIAPVVVTETQIYLEERFYVDF